MNRGILQAVGAARTGAYFPVAPFFGAELALVLPGERPDLAFWVAGAPMALGVRLHVSEHHQHCGGIVSATVLTLLVLPVLYPIFHRDRQMQPTIAPGSR